MQKRGRVNAAKAIFLRPRFALFALAAGMLYYALFQFVAGIGSHGIFLITLPEYAVAAASAASAVLLTIAVYTTYNAGRQEVKKGAVGGGVVSAVSTFIGGMVAGCGCSAPLLGTLLYAVGINVFGVSSAINYIGKYQMPIIGIVILIDVLLSYYYLGVSAVRCRVNRSRAKKRG